MCNEKKNENNTPLEDSLINDYKFIDYRLTQLENKLEKGLSNIEKEQRQYQLEVMKTLKDLQEGQVHTTETMAKVQQRIEILENQNICIDKLKEVANRNTSRLDSTNHRIDVVQKILFAVGGAAVSAFFAAAFSIIQVLMK